MILLYDAKKTAGGISALYDRCLETPNYYEFYKDKDYSHKPTYVSKVTGSIVDSEEFFRDIFHDIWMKRYELGQNEDKEIENYSYCYYPDLKAVTKSDGCTFFDAKKGFIFDIDGDWFMEGPIGPVRKHSIISAEEAFEIVSSDDYGFLFFNGE